MEDSNRIETIFWNIEKNYQLAHFFITLGLLGIQENKDYDIDLIIQNKDIDEDPKVHSYEIGNQISKHQDTKLADDSYSVSVTAGFDIALVQGLYRVHAILKQNNHIVDTKNCWFYVRKQD